MTGTVTISIEIELAWGTHDKVGANHEAISDRRRAETTALRQLLAMTDALNIPITFPVVGHLMESRCHGVHEGPHTQGWFEADPGTNVESDPIFYAPDLIEMVLESTTDHEIGTHTYSHVLCDEASDAVIDWEFEHAVKLHEEFDTGHPISFVPPRHKQPSIDALKRNGIRIIREPYDGYDRSNSKFGSFKEALTRTHPVGTTKKSDDMVKTFCTTHPSLTTEILPTGQRPPHPAFQVLPKRLRKRVHTSYLKRAIDDAADSSGSVHLWTHLYNLSNPVQLNCIREGLEYLARRRNEGSVEVREMQSLVDTQRGE